MKQLVSVVQVCILGCMIEANITNTIWMIIIIHLSCNSSTSTLLLLCLLGWSLNEKLSSLLWWLQWELLSLSDSLLSRSLLSENVGARGTTARFCIWDREKQAPHLWWKRKIVYICSAQSENLHNLEIALRILGIPRLRTIVARSRDRAAIARNLLPDTHVQKPSCGFERSY